MSKRRVRVEARRQSSYMSYDERMKDLVILLRRFNRACEDYDIPHMIKEHADFTRPCDKRRKKEEERQLAIRRGQNENK